MLHFGLCSATFVASANISLQPSHLVPVDDSVGAPGSGIKSGVGFGFSVVALGWPCCTGGITPVENGLVTINVGGVGGSALMVVLLSGALWRLALEHRVTSGMMTIGLHSVPASERLRWYLLVALSLLLPPPPPPPPRLDTCSDSGTCFLIRSMMF